MNRFLLSILSVFSMVLAAAAVYAGVVDATDKTYYDEVVRSDRPVVLEFWAPYCPACRKMSGVVDQLAKEYDGKLKVVKINTEDNMEVAKKYNVDRIPSFFYVKDGYTEGSTIGGMNLARLKKELGLPAPDKMQ